MIASSETEEATFTHRSAGLHSFLGNGDKYFLGVRSFLSFFFLIRIIYYSHVYKTVVLNIYFLKNLCLALSLIRNCFKKCHVWIASLWKHFSFVHWETILMENGWNLADCMVTLMQRAAGRGPPSSLWRGTDMGTTCEAEKRGIILVLGTTLRNIILL